MSGYATVDAPFVSIQIGGTLTPFTALPVLMVTAIWTWDFAFMLGAFEWRAAIAVALNAAVVTLLFRRELQRIEVPADCATTGRAWRAGPRLGTREAR